MGWMFLMDGLEACCEYILTNADVISIVANTW